MAQVAVVPAYSYLDLAAIGASPECELEFAQALGLHVYRCLREGWLPAHDRLDHRLSQLYAMFNGSSLQSPIEQRLAAHLVWMEAAGLDPKCDEMDEMAGEGPPAGFERFLIQPQAQIGKYRADFLVGVGANGHWRKVVVECDGHNYHERTKEQAAHDKERDRFMTLGGYKILRFAGSEIYKDAGKCADQIQELAEQLFREIA